jgi:hypothetical protein
MRKEESAVEKARLKSEYKRIMKQDVILIEEDKKERCGEGKC